jgi:hypothetical protein
MTRLIEEGALLPESVRSESESWTSFYMAGAITRELRKAHEGARTIGCRLNQSIGLARGTELGREEMITLIKVERILNL